MNYLAHLFLADDSDEFLIGSFLGDFVKGAVDDRYSEEITRGIIFHRKIDTYADAHERTVASRNLFKPERRRFAGIIVDICYDHFLAKHWPNYSDIKLSAFISYVYETLQTYYEILPERLKYILPRMIKQNWLESYQTIDGVEITLNRISKRITKENSLKGSIEEIRLNYNALEKNFLDFLPDLVVYAKSYRLEPEK
jgi:acyl carrier protein phosphodiesterase